MSSNVRGRTKVCGDDTTYFPSNSSDCRVCRRSLTTLCCSIRDGARVTRRRLAAAAAAGCVLMKLSVVVIYDKQSVIISSTVAY